MDRQEVLSKDNRIVVWFSCGAASSVAAKLATAVRPDAEVVYCDTMETEHEDNQRFFKDIEKWLGKSITKIKSENFTDVDDVFETGGYMAGVYGAKCTTEMKKIPRRNFQQDNDIHVFGFTFDEERRADRFKANNPELRLWDVLGNTETTKDDCLRILAQAQIEIPTMYKLGYNNNNCLGCVKASGGTYWNMVRRDFPEVFDRRVEQSRALNVRLVKVEGERVFLDELPEDYMPLEPLEDISCGPDCGPGEFEWIE